MGLTHQATAVAKPRRSPRVPEGPILSAYPGCTLHSLAPCKGTRCHLGLNVYYYSILKKKLSEAN